MEVFPMTPEEILEDIPLPKEFYEEMAQGWGADDDEFYE